MKHIKLFEEDDNKPIKVPKDPSPKVGDYVITYSDINHVLNDFLTTHLGQISHIDTTGNYNKALYRINYDNIPKHLSHNFLKTFSGRYGYFYIDDILHHDKNPDNLQLYITASKYNL